MLERKIVGAIILMFGLTILGLGLYVGQIGGAINLIEDLLEVCKAGLP